MVNLIYVKFNNLYDIYIYIYFEKQTHTHRQGRGKGVLTQRHTTTPLK